MDYKKYIESIPDFPAEGVLFRDITPLLANGEVFADAIKQLSAFASSQGAQLVAGPESRGFIFGCPVACELGIGFVPVRKPGKLPRKTISYQYDLEYGSNELSMHADAVKPGQKVIVVDDLLATGGTAEAAINLIKQMGGEVVGCAFLIELDALNGRERLKDYPLFSLIHY